MKSSSEIKIQKYENGHLDGVVALHEDCFTKKDNFAMCLGEAFLYSTYKFFIKDEKCFGFVAICNGRIVGVLLGRLDYYTTELNKYRLMAAFRGLIFHPTLLVNKRLIQQAMKNIIRQVCRRKYEKKAELSPSHLEGKTATLASFCIHPEYRKLNIGEQLLALAEEFCRKKNMKYLRTGVQRNNVASRFAFRSRGYIVDQVLSQENDLLYYLPLSCES